ncbi:MAG: prepilin peptidase [Burkholderiales bacterium]|nr:A24 family peptidase [Burkholderiales bacterium]MDE2609054.1 prepilin peptidase [Burkholderiales bacterium]
MLHEIVEPVLFDRLATLPPPWRYGLAGLAGLLIGSFLNVVIHRLPRMLERAWQAELDELGGGTPGRIPVHAEPPYNLWHPGSSCPACGHRLRPWENIPLVSFVVLRGRCSACRQAIARRYPAVELLSAALSVLVVWQLGATWQGVAALGLTYTLITLAFIDTDTQLLPDCLTLPLLWAGLLCNLAGLFVPLRDAVLGAMGGYLSLWLVYWIFRLLRGKEGMGYGDFKLLAALGAWLGWAVLPQIVLLSSISGAAIGIAAVLAGRQARHEPIPFGPFLAAAGVLTLLTGNLAWRWLTI